MKERKGHSQQMNLRDEREESDSGMYLNLLAEKSGEPEAAMHLNEIVDRPKDLQKDAQDLIRAVAQRDRGQSEFDDPAYPLFGNQKVLRESGDSPQPPE